MNVYVNVLHSYDTAREWYYNRNYRMLDIELREEDTWERITSDVLYLQSSSVKFLKDFFSPNHNVLNLSGIMEGMDLMIPYPVVPSQTHERGKKGVIGWPSLQNQES